MGKHTTLKVHAFQSSNHQCCIMYLFGRPHQIHIEMTVVDLSFLLKASLISGRSVLCALFLCFAFVSLIFASLTSGFVHQLEILFGYRQDISQRFRWYNDSLHLDRVGRYPDCHTVLSTQETNK
jgi:hypothetical protein